MGSMRPKEQPLTPDEAACLARVRSAAKAVRDAESRLGLLRTTRLRTVRQEASTLAGIGWTRAGRELGGLIGASSLRAWTVGLVDVEAEQ